MRQALCYAFDREAMVSVYDGMGEDIYTIMSNKPGTMTDFSDCLLYTSFDVEGEMAFRAKAVVDSLEGNSLIHPLTTPVIEINDDCSKARAVWWSLGVEGLSKFREQPMAIISLGMVPGTHVKEDGEWKILSGAWQRTTKCEYHKGWVHSMEPVSYTHLDVYKRQ